MEEDSISCLGARTVYNFRADEVISKAGRHHKEGDQRVSVAHCYGCRHFIDHYALYESNPGNRSEAHPDYLYLLHDPSFSCYYLLQK